MNNHEELVKKHYPDYNPVGEKFKPKKVWPTIIPVKKKKRNYLPLYFIIMFVLGMGSIIFLIEIEELENYYTQSSNLNLSYQLGIQDAFTGIINYTSIINVEHEGKVVELRCFIPQNLNETGGK